MHAPFVHVLCEIQYGFCIKVQSTAGLCDVTLKIASGIPLLSSQVGVIWHPPDKIVLLVVGCPSQLSFKEEIMYFLSKSAAPKNSKNQKRKNEKKEKACFIIMPDLTSCVTAQEFLVR